MVFTLPKQFSINSLLSIRIGNVYISFTNSSLYLLLATGLVVLFLYLITLNAGYLSPTCWQSVVEMIYQFVTSLVEKSKTIPEFFYWFMDFKMELTCYNLLIKTASAELFLIAGLTVLFIFHIFSCLKTSQQLKEKYNFWIRQMICRICLFAAILFWTNPLIQNIVGDKIHMLTSCTALGKALVGTIIMAAILLIFILYKIKKWFVFRCGNTCFKIISIIVGVIFITYIMGSKVYPNHFSILQMGSLVIASVVAFFIFLYCWSPQIDLEGVIKKTYYFVCVARIIPFLVLAAQNGIPLFLFLLLCIFDAIIGWTMLEIDLPEFKCRPFNLSSLKDFIYKIKNICWDYRFLLPCQGDLESLESQVKPVKPVTALKMEGVSQPNLPETCSEGHYTRAASVAATVAAVPPEGGQVGTHVPGQQQGMEVCPELCQEGSQQQMEMEVGVDLSLFQGGQHQVGAHVPRQQQEQGMEVRAELCREGPLQGRRAGRMPPQWAAMTAAQPAPSLSTIIEEKEISSKDS